jgi:hypothetical protein
MRFRVFFGEIPQQCKSKRRFATFEAGVLLPGDDGKPNGTLKLLMIDNG